MRIFDIIKSELNSDKLKLEEELERVINHKDIDTDGKVKTIKELLREISLLEISFKKFEKYTSDETNTNDETN